MATVAVAFREIGYQITVNSLINYPVFFQLVAFNVDILVGWLLLVET